MTSLPSSANAKLIRIQGLATDSRDAATSAHRRITEIKYALATDEVKREDVDKLHAEMERLERVRTDQNARYSVLAGLATALTAWHRSVSPHVEIVMAKPVVAKTARGETIADAVERIRSEIKGRRSKLNEIRNAPRPKSALKAMAKGYVAELAKLGSPRVTTARGTFDVSFASEAAYGFGPRRVSELLAWLDPERFEKRIVEEIAAMPEPTLVLTDDEKAKMVAETSEELDRLERVEEALIEQAHAQGQEILRRDNASPLAVLGVRLRRSNEEAA